MKYSLFALLLVCSLQMNAQRLTPDSLLTCDTNPQFVHFNDVQIFQFLGKDSTKGKISYSEKHDSLGRIIACCYTGHKENSATAFSDVLDIREYGANGKIAILTSYYNEPDMRGEVNKTFYYYSDTTLIALERYSLKKRIKADVDKGNGRPGGCIILPEDYEKDPAWKLDQQTKYESSNGVQTASYSTASNTSQNGWEYTYDAQGRILTKQSLDGSRLIYTEYFRYSGDTVFSELVWANPDWSGTKKMKVYAANSKRLTAEFTTQSNKTWEKRYTYDAKGRLVKYQYLKPDGTPDLTHNYRYAD